MANYKITTVSTNDSGSSVATDADQLRKEFQKVGDYDGAYGLQCVDIVRWYVDTYTTLNSTSGHGKDLVANLANKYGLKWKITKWLCREKFEILDAFKIKIIVCFCMTVDHVGAFGNDILESLYYANVETMY